MKKIIIFKIIIFCLFSSLNCTKPPAKYDISLKLKVDFSAIEAESEKGPLVDKTIRALSERIIKFGVVSAEVVSPEPGIISLKAKTWHGLNKIKELILSNGRLEYRFVDDKYTELAEKWTRVNPVNRELLTSKSEQEKLLKKISGAIKLPEHLEILFQFYFERNTQILYPSNPIVIGKKVEIDNKDMKKLWVDKDNYGNIVILFETTPKGKEEFVKITAPKYRGKRLAALINNQIRMSPRIAEQISSGRGMISGAFTKTEAEALAFSLKLAPIPIPLTILEQKEVNLQPNVKKNK
ncbi:MAG: hypothetical protein GY754_24615 [bacterium]|nr:hypothetical protein [bacterium]